MTNQSITKKIRLDFGYETIAGKYFKKDIPGEAEVEYAINFIEDELMSHEELVNDGDALYIDEKFMMDLIKPENGTRVITRQEIEEIFTKYALVSMGRSPIYDNVEINKERYAKLLILREIMHHLDFMCVNLQSGMISPDMG